MPALSQITPKPTPRALNAFFLFRSDFLKRGAIPPVVEQRQQNLSRIARQCSQTLTRPYGMIKQQLFEQSTAPDSPPTIPGYYKDKKIHPAKDKREGNGSNLRCSFDCSQPPCHDNAFSSSTPNISPVSPASVPSSSTTVSFSPLTLMHLLHTNSSSQGVTPIALDDMDGGLRCMNLSSVSKNPRCPIIHQFLNSP